MRAAIYARVSTNDARQDPENQLAELRRFAAANGWEVFREYIDYESGGSPQRAEFRRLFDDARRRQFDVVVFWALDRFSREGAFPTLQRLNELTSYGVQFRSYSEQYLDSCGIFGEAVISILAVIAKQERQRISDRTRAGLDRARAAGKRLGRPPAKIDRGRLARLVRDGASVTQISRDLRISRRTVRRQLASLA